MNKYELMLIIDPTLSEDDRKSVIEGLKSDIKLIWKIEKEDVWGERKLAYKIKSSSVGYYVLYTLELDGLKIKEFTNKVNLNKKVWRNMFVRLDA